MTRAKDISKIVTDADLSGTLDVTGTVTAGGLTVDGTDATITITGTRGTGDTHTISAAGANNQNLNISADDSIYLRTSDTVQRIGIFSGGDISFYEDTGTTPKLFWDASAERLGIGTASPSNPFEVIGSEDANIATFSTLGDGGGASNRGLSIAADSYGGSIRTVGSSVSMGFDVNGSERMRIDSNGEVTIQGDAKRLIFGASGDSEMAHYADGQFAFKNTDAQGFTFYTGAGPTERFRIDANGHVTMPHQSAFLATKTANANNFTIGSQQDVTFTTEVYDQNADFASSTFTAPVTGKYYLKCSIYLSGVDTAVDYYAIRINTSNRVYIKIFTPKFTADVDFMSMEVSTVADMDASDTASIQIIQSSGTAQTDIQGNAAYTYFTGFLAC